jgi:hypothetical protein
MKCGSRSIIFMKNSAHLWMSSWRDAWRDEWEREGCRIWIEARRIEGGRRGKEFVAGFGCLDLTFRGRKWLRYCLDLSKSIDFQGLDIARKSSYLASHLLTKNFRDNVVTNLNLHGIQVLVKPLHSKNHHFHLNLQLNFYFSSTNKLKIPPSTSQLKTSQHPVEASKAKSLHLFRLFP